MDLYHKPTSTQRYLLYSASHSKQCLKNILYVMTRQVCAIEGNNSITNKCLGMNWKGNLKITATLEKWLVW